MGISHHRWLHLAGLVCLISSVTVVSEKQLQVAIASPPPQIAQAPNTSPSESALNRGLELIQRGAVEEAIASFREAIELDP